MALDYNTIALLALIFMVIIVIVSWWLLGTTLDPNPVQHFKLSDLETLLDPTTTNSLPDQFGIQQMSLGFTLSHYFGSMAWAFAHGRDANFQNQNTKSKIAAALPLRIPYNPTIQAELNQSPSDLKQRMAHPIARETAWATHCGLFKLLQPTIQSILQTTIETLPPRSSNLSPDLIIYLDKFEPIQGTGCYIFQRPQWYNYALAEAGRRLQRSLAELKVLILLPEDPLCHKMVDDLMAELTVRNIMTLTSDEDESFRLMLSVPALISSGGVLASMAAWGSSNLMITPDLLEIPEPHCRENWLILPSNPIDPREVSTDSEILIVADKLRSHLKRRQSSLLGTLM